MFDVRFRRLQLVVRHQHYLVVITAEDFIDVRVNVVVAVAVRLHRRLLNTHSATVTQSVSLYLPNVVA